MSRFNWLFGRSPKPPQQNQPQAVDHEPHMIQENQTSTRPSFSHANHVPEGDFRFIALDVETACSDAASICQIGLSVDSGMTKMEHGNTLFRICRGGPKGGLEMQNKT
ncbi:hypothetical protein OO012_13795 [Rhodobacteraceae bacterium KMM 6894]|nr:hypothetical protein [Rhodobacteraceae bacterium KMM 6894]